MQCFQKDPNLRVSARKLLKHPWIVNAKRSDAVVPKKPTEYDEAVRSVQQWNEALKSPNAGSLRKASRPISSSPILGRREPNRAILAPARASLSVAKPRVSTEQFRSPSHIAEDNWDDDFDSAITPSALQLPHLRPHDNFGGLLSAEKLKAFASIDTVTEEADWDEKFEGDLTVRSPSQPNRFDPLQTIRPYSSKPASTHLSNKMVHAETPEAQNPPSGSRRASTAPAVHQKRLLTEEPVATSLSTAFIETTEDDFSDLIVEDTAFDRKFGKSGKVRSILRSRPVEVKQVHYSRSTPWRQSPSIRQI